MVLTASRTSVLLLASTVHTWGLPMNVSAYGCWEEICDPKLLITTLVFNSNYTVFSVEGVAYLSRGGLAFVEVVVV